MNPKFRPVGRETSVHIETCMSMLGWAAAVERFARVEIKALDREGRPVRRRAGGLEARILQHETDHTYGVLFTDRMDPRTLTHAGYLDNPPADDFEDALGAGFAYEYEDDDAAAAAAQAGRPRRGAR